MILPVNFFSQADKTVAVGWQSRICALACVKMVLDFELNRTLEIKDLIVEALALDGHDERYGWKHESLVKLLRNHGVPAYAQEFRSREYRKVASSFVENSTEGELATFGWRKISESLKKGQPVIVSVLRQFKQENSFHQVLLVGLEETGEEVKSLYYLDPENPPEKSVKPSLVTREDFFKGWRKLSIFTEKVKQFGFF